MKHLVKVKAKRRAQKFICLFHDLTFGTNTKIGKVFRVF